MSEQTSRLAIVLDSTGAKRNTDTLATSLERLTAQGEKATGSTDELGFSFKRLATSAAGAMSIGLVVKMVDDWGQVAAQVKMALKSVEGDIDNYTNVQQRFLEISNRNGKDIAITQKLYTGAASSMKELGYNTEQTIDYVESLSSIFTANATSAMATDSAINSLNKSMITGRVAGDNWNAVMNAAPSILSDIARELERTNGGVKVTENQVKKLGAEGKISFKLMADSIQKAKEANNALADSMDNTVADGLTRITNSAKAYYGEMNQSLGITRAMSASLAGISDNFGTVGAGLTAVIGIGAARYFGNLANSIYDTTKKSAENALVNRKLAVDKLNVARATLVQAQNEKTSAITAIESTKAQQAAATTEVQRISLKTQLANQTAVLTAATKAETVATTELAAAQGRLSVANNLVKGGLALVGGPIGLAMLAAGGMYAFATSMQQAKADAIDLSRGLDGIISKLKEMTREQKLIKIGELENSHIALESAIRKAEQAKADAFRGTFGKAQAIEKEIVGTREHTKAVEEAERAQRKYEAASASLSVAKDDLRRAQNTAKVIQADLNGTLQQGADLLKRNQSILPDFSAAWRGAGINIGAAANALGRFNAESLQLNFTDGGARLKQQLERDIALAKKTGEARERLRAQYAAEDAGETKPENIKVLEDAAAELYNLNQASKELNKTSTYSESAAQKMLSSLKEQQMVLMQQRNANGALGTQQQALVKWEQQLADIKSKKTLTADQKSLLTNAELITLEMKHNAEIEKTIQHKDAEAKIAAYNKQLMEETAQAQRAYTMEREGAGMGTLYRSRLQEELRLKEEYLKKEEALTAQFNDKSTGITQEMYDKESQIIKGELDKRIAMMQGHFNQQDVLRQDWKLGVSESFLNYAETARHYSQQAENFVTNSLNNMTDGSANALTDIVTNSKNAFDAIGDFFGDLSKSIIKDLIRIAIQAQITNAISGLFPISGGGNPKGSFDAGLKGLGLFSSGGYTGNGNKYDPRGIVHAGEFVFTKEATDRIGADNLYRMMNSGGTSSGSMTPDAYAMKNIHPANQTNNTTNNASNSTESNNEQSVTYVINQTVQVYGNGEKALAEVVKVAANRGAKAAVAEIQRDFATNGKTRKLLG